MVDVKKSFYDPKRGGVEQLQHLVALLVLVEILVILIVLAKQEGGDSCIFLHPHTETQNWYDSWKSKIHIPEMVRNPRLQKVYKSYLENKSPDEVRFKRPASSGSNSAMIWFTFSSKSVVTTSQYTIGQTTSKKIP